MAERNPCHPTFKFQPWNCYLPFCILRFTLPKRGAFDMVWRMLISGCRLICKFAIMVSKFDCFIVPFLWFQFLKFHCVIFNVAISMLESNRCHPKFTSPTWRLYFPFSTLHLKFPKLCVFAMRWRRLICCCFLICQPGGNPGWPLWFPTSKISLCHFQNCSCSDGTQPVPFKT